MTSLMPIGVTTSVGPAAPGKGKQSPPAGADSFAAILALLQFGQVAQNNVGSLIPSAPALAAAGGEQPVPPTAMPGLWSAAALAGADGASLPLLGEQAQANGSGVHAEASAALPVVPAVIASLVPTAGAAGPLSGQEPGAGVALAAEPAGHSATADAAEAHRLASGASQLDRFGDFLSPFGEQTGGGQRHVDEPGLGYRQAALPQSWAPAVATANEAESRQSTAVAGDGELAVASQALAVTDATLAQAAKDVAVPHRAEHVPVHVWQQVLRQVEARGHELRPDGQSLDVQLHPAHLGSVRLRLTIVEGQLIAHLQVASAAARDSLALGLTELRQSLHDQGFDVQSLTVDVRDSGQHAEQHARHAWHGQQPWRSSTYTDEASMLEADASAGSGGLTAAHANGVLDIRA